MDINKENDILETKNGEELTTAIPEEETATTQTEQIVAEEPKSEEMEEDGNEEMSTMSIDMQDIDRELSRYGLVDTEETQPIAESSESELPQKNEGVVQKPIIIAAIAFLLTAVIALGTMFTYKMLTKPAFIGSWSQAGDYNGKMFLTFDNDGNVALDMGGFERYGYYTTDKVNGFDVIHTDFYELSLISKDIVTTYSEDKNTMQVYFIYEGADLTSLDATVLEAIAMGSIEFHRGKAPAFSINPAEVTHASADELGITEVVVDNDVIGTWQVEIMGTEDKYETYVFNADGTGSRTTDYVYYETYACGLGENGNFKYCAKDGNLLITYNYFDGTTQDLTMNYSIDKGNLVMDGTGYNAVK